MSWNVVDTCVRPIKKEMNWTETPSHSSLLPTSLSLLLRTLLRMSKVERKCHPSALGTARCRTQPVAASGSNNQKTQCKDLFTDVPVKGRYGVLSNSMELHSHACPQEVWVPSVAAILAECDLSLENLSVLSIAIGLTKNCLFFFSSHAVRVMTAQTVVQTRIPFAYNYIDLRIVHAFRFPEWLKCPHDYGRLFRLGIYRIVRCFRLPA